MNKNIDAVNYCNSRIQYLNQLAAAQWRTNVNRTTELVLWMRDGEIIAETTVTPQNVRQEVINPWR